MRLRFAIAVATARGATGIGLPLVRFGLLIGRPLSLSRPRLSNRIAIAVAWSFLTPSLDMNIGIALSIRWFPALDPMYIFCLANGPSKKVVAIAWIALAYNTI